MKIIFVRKKKQISNYETFIANNYKKKIIRNWFKKKRNHKLIMLRTVTALTNCDSMHTSTCITSVD